MGWYIVFLILCMVIWVTVRSSCLQDINSASTPLVLGSLSNDDGNSNENGKKAIGLDWQNKKFARAYNVEEPNFTFCPGREHKPTTFYFFSWTFRQSFWIQL